MIKIEGLSPEQKMICDQIWSFETQDQVVEWFNTLPIKKRRQAHVMLELIIAAVHDVNEHMDTSLAKKVLRQFQLA